MRRSIAPASAPDDGSNNGNGRTKSAAAVTRDQGPNECGTHPGGTAVRQALRRRLPQLTWQPLAILPKSQSRELDISPHTPAARDVKAQVSRPAWLKAPGHTTVNQAEVTSSGAMPAGVRLPKPLTSTTASPDALERSRQWGMLACPMHSPCAKSKSVTRSRPPSQPITNRSSPSPLVSVSFPRPPNSNGKGSQESNPAPSDFAASSTACASLQPFQSSSYCIPASCRCTGSSILATTGHGSMFCCHLAPN